MELEIDTWYSGHKPDSVISKTFQVLDVGDDAWVYAQVFVFFNSMLERIMPKMNAVQ